MSSRNKYIKSAIPYTYVNKILDNNKHLDNIVWFIDLQSIAKGFYNADNVFFEINHYIENRKPAGFLINELKDYLNNLYLTFKKSHGISSKFVIFYDNGKNLQNIGIDTSYKGGRSSIVNLIESTDEQHLYKEIKQNYFNEIELLFDKKRDRVGHIISDVINLHDYESDFIPYYFISKNIRGYDDPNHLKLVISNDKDLLQCCVFKNTFQITNTFYPSRNTGKRFNINVWNDNNAISYIHKKFKEGILTSKYIPLILSIAGDTADGIHGIKGYGVVKTVSYIQNLKVPDNIHEIKALGKDIPLMLKDNIKKIEANYKMISFVEQMKRVRCLDKLTYNFKNGD